MKRELNGLIKKELLHPIKGEYSEDGRLIEIGLSDEQGVVELRQLMFSVQGESGSYGIRFYCDGFYVDSDQIIVESRV